jgi:hypothetical protein
VSEPKKFPGMRWHPITGENQIFQAESEVPEGYLNYHPANPPEGVEKALETKPEALPMTRKEIVKVLNDGGIIFDPKAKVPALYDLLVASLKAHLIASETAFPETATGPELLALVPQPE